MAVPSNKLIGLLLITVILTSAIPLTVDGTAYTGDVDITVPTVWKNDVISIKGNLTVHSTLEIDNCTLIMEADGSFIKAVSGSTLNISTTSIGSANSNIHYSIFIDEGVNFSLKNSHIDNFGSKDPERLSTATAGAEYNEYNRYLWILADFTRDLTLSGSDGLEIRSSTDSFSNNTFTNYTVIRIYSSWNLVEHNTFDHMSFEGLAFMTGSDNNIIRHNVFKNALRMNREIFGLRFYPGTSYNKISYNLFEWLPTSCMVGNIPPWTTGRYFEFHHNICRKVIFGIGGNMQNAILHHNQFYDLMSTGISLEANRYTVVHNNTIRNIYFQRELENVIDQNYYQQVNGRGILPNMAYWMFGFYCSKFMMALGWSAYRVTIKDNLFENAPPYTMALNMDTPEIMDQVFIRNNTFRNIETYVASGFTIRRDYTGYNVIANVTPLSGGCIMLERAEKVFIENNKFVNVLHGVVTSAPDALGNFGNFTIRDNYFRGVSSFSWMEQRGSWWSGSYPTVGEGIGIATGMDFIGGTHETYFYDSQQDINNNTLYNFKYPLVVDFSRYTSNLGIKYAYISDNLFLNYSLVINTFDSPNNVIFESNIYKKEYPDSLVNITVIDNHTKMVSGDYYLLPPEIIIPWFRTVSMVKWNNISLIGGKLADLLFTIDGLEWQWAPPDGDIESLSPDSGRIKFMIRTRSYDIKPRTLALTYTTNSPVSVNLNERLNGKKNEPVFITPEVKDDDDSEFIYKWSYVKGPVAEPEMENITSGTLVFIPRRSGNYTFGVEVSDGFTSASATTYVTVDNTGPELEVNGSVIGFKRELITMNATVKDADNDNLSIQWRQVTGPAVDLINSTGLHAGFIPEAVGTYLFDVVVSDFEQSNFSQVEVIVKGKPPSVNLEISSKHSFENGEIFLSANGSSDPDGNITGYLFNFGDGTDSGWINESYTSHNYTRHGFYLIYLIVMDDDGMLSNRFYEIIEISRRTVPPEASFTVLPETGDLNTVFAFNSTSHDEDGVISLCVWDFGDGIGAKGERVTHRYIKTGTYSVRLKVIDGDELETYFEREIVVVKSLGFPSGNHPPEILTFQPQKFNTAVAGKRYHFKISVVDEDNDNLNMSWYLNNEFLGDETDVYIIFTTTGKNSVKLIVTDGTNQTSIEWSVNVRSAGETDLWEQWQRIIITVFSVSILILALVLIFIKKKIFKRGIQNKSSNEFYKHMAVMQGGGFESGGNAASNEPAQLPASPVTDKVINSGLDPGELPNSDPGINSVAAAPPLTDSSLDTDTGTDTDTAT